MFAPPPPPENLDKYEERRLHMEQLYKSHLIEFDLSMRILIPLENAGIRTLGDLAKQSKASLRRINQLGRLSVEKLDMLMERLGLELAKQ